MKLGKLGVWTSLDSVTAARSLEIAKRVEDRGYAALWLPESRGRNVLVHSAWLLAGTTKLMVAPGIANIYARDAMAMAAGQRGLNAQSGGRFPLGPPLTILAAPGPRMRALSAEHADGAHPYNVPPEHTAQARRILGPGKLRSEEHT